MHKKLCTMMALILVFAGIGASAEVHTREYVRKLYGEMVRYAEKSPYGEIPSAEYEYSAGKLRDEACEDALSYVNFLRELAYLDGNVQSDKLYALRAQYGAVLLAANDAVAHDSPRPADMPENFYETALAGTMSSNIAGINWMSGDILVTAVEYFVRDDGEANLSTLGHRRWLLNPQMGYTGFGLANSASGISYVAMYAHDLSAQPGSWDSVKWPSEGAFPADLMGRDIAWSVTLNPEVYDISASDISVSVYEKTRGKADIAYFCVDTEAYGAGPCVIFVPDIAALGLDDYQQNQVYTVRIDGLRNLDGTQSAIEYTVEMMSLMPVDAAAVEVEPRALLMNAGDVCQLGAAVIPDWADDTGVEWSTDDASVATVDSDGRVTAVGTGSCEITASAANGRTDACEVSVK